ncbi:MAG: response regulator transcription factor [Chloroflexia bacterium]
MISILLADDQPFMRECLRMRLELEPDLRIVGEAGDGEAAISLACDCCPDVVIMDISMPILDGLAATAALRAILPATAVIVHSLYDDDITRARARAAGAKAFVGKHTLEEPLIAAIRAAAVRHEA